MLVVGIDPGTSKTGVAFINNKSGIVYRGVFSIITDERFPDRYWVYEKRLDGILMGLSEPPALVAIENNPPELPIQDLRKLFNQVHLEGIYGVTCSVVHRIFPNAVVTPITTSTWRPHGDKIDTLGQMYDKYDLVFNNDDEADALAIADHLIVRMCRGEKIRFNPGLLRITGGVENVGIDPNVGVQKHEYPQKLS